MASFYAAKMLANYGAVAAFAGCVASTGLYAGKKALAAEKVQPEEVKCESSKKNASSDRKSGLSFAPEFDGLNCFETIVSSRKQESAGKQASSPIASVPKRRELVYAPQFDGLHCFETIISRPRA